MLVAFSINPGLFALGFGVALTVWAVFHWALFTNSKPLFDLVFRLFVDHLDIVKNGDLYLRRFYLTNRINWPSWFLDLFPEKYQRLLKSRLFLHWIVRSDDDRDPHDHPWSFKSWILDGMYVERVWFPGLSRADERMVVEHDVRYYPVLGRRHWCRQAFAGTTLDNHWSHTHMLQVIEPVWSLVLAGPKERVDDEWWGFWIMDQTDPLKDRWVHQKEYKTEDGVNKGDEVRS
jgi:hypothetical protein